MQAIRIPAYTITSCLGRGVASTLAALLEHRGGLAPCDFETVDLDTWIGAVDGVDDEVIAPELARFDCRNNRLAQIGLMQDGFADAVRAAIDTHGADRIGVFLGTSTAGILQTELAYREREQRNDQGSLPAWYHYAETHNTYSVADFVSKWFGLRGPAVAVSAACASSAKVFGNAARMLASGRIDAAIVGGVDTLCLTTLYGFRSLELVSSKPAQPYGVDRDGLSIGEAAAFALLERCDDRATNRSEGYESAGAPLLVGVGESSDAHHMSSPHPEGLGARLAMEAALRSASLAPHDIDYINLHGTATRNNDAAEDKAVFGLFGRDVPLSSTKGATGHTLGAAGGVEAVISLIALREGLIPGGLNTTTVDPSLQSDYRIANSRGDLRRVLSNSFGFGGANCSLLFARA
ncbi:MAG: beta-ketoacyl-[acyl-carrier-protein] synthase family protein [Burkholderiaceae bacterium]